MMTKPASSLPQSDPELEWFYRWSAAECGIRSPNLEGIAIPSSDPPEMTERQMDAASKQRRIRAALLQLSPFLQGILEACYEPRPHAVQLRHEHGIAAGWVARHMRDKDASAEKLHAQVVAAHEAFRVARGGKAPRTRKERAERWLSEEVGAGRWDGAGPCHA